MGDFEKMKKDELVTLVKGLEAKVVEFEASAGNGGTSDAPAYASGMVQILSLWGTDPQNNPYRDKNGRKFFVGQLNARVYLSSNAFKTAGSRQPDLRGSVMPFRPQGDGAGDLFDDLGDEQSGSQAIVPF